MKIYFTTRFNIVDEKSKQNSLSWRSRNGATTIFCIADLRRESRIFSLVFKMLAFHVRNFHSYSQFENV